MFGFLSVVTDGMFNLVNIKWQKLAVDCMKDKQEQSKLNSRICLLKGASALNVSWRSPFLWSRDAHKSWSSRSSLKSLVVILSVVSLALFHPTLHSYI